MRYPWLAGGIGVPHRTGARRAAATVGALLIGGAATGASSLAGIVTATPPAAATAAGATAPGPGSLATGYTGPSSPTPAGVPGYWMVAGDGGVFDYGSSTFEGSPAGRPGTPPIVGMLPTPTGRGYWLAAANGGVYAFGDAPFLGSAVVRPAGAAPIVAIAGTPTGAGYWLFGADGRVYTLGDATYFGAPPPSALHAPIVTAAATPDGQGYWIVAADGAVYPEGDAAVIGDASSVHLAQPIVGMAPTPSGRGYWLVARDGGIFSYGDAAFHGSTGAIALNQPIVSAVSTASGQGYWLFAADGGVFSFGDARFLGSTGNLHLDSPVVAARSAPADHGTATAIFYYPWYASFGHDGYWRHWDEGGHTPPLDIGSDYYPMRGAYSSLDPSVLESQMGDIAAAGVNEVVVSWWGQGSFEDGALPLVVAAARDHGVQVAVHLEPYVGRSGKTVASDYAYLTGLGIDDIWVYQADLLPADELAATNHDFPAVRTMAESGDVSFVRSGGFARWAWQAGFTGIYLYDAINYGPGDFPAFCASARAYGLVCAPVAAPGFSAVRATGARYGKSRANGQTYDERWMGDLGARPDLVAITSYNEWHEGTQIEEAVPMCLSSTFCYLNYTGAYGTTGLAATYAYLNRTGLWTGRLRADHP
jgi:hypothetical protein